MASTSCAPSVPPAPLINTSNLFGQICGANLPLTANIDITSCCDAGAEVRAQDDCAQFCKHSGSQDDFRSCVAGLFRDRPVVEVYCEAVNEGIGAPESSVSSAASESASATVSNSEGVATSSEEVVTSSEGVATTTEGIPTTTGGVEVPTGATGGEPAPTDTGAASHFQGSSVGGGLVGGLLTFALAFLGL